MEQGNEITSDFQTFGANTNLNCQPRWVSFQGRYQVLIHTAFHSVVPAVRKEKRLQL